MIHLSGTGDYLTLFVLTSVAGLIGGLASELLLSRNGETGTFELPARKEGLFDLGGFAPLLIGAVVGVAILIVFPPETTIVTNAADGSTTSIRGYDTVRVVATSLIAGSAGGSVLSALQARVTAAVNESRVAFTAATGEQQVEQLRQTATAEASEQIRAAISALTASGGVVAAPGARPRGALSDVPEATPGRAPDDVADDAIASFSASMERHSGQARATIEEAARRR
jgi:hypothetical protein